MICHIFHVPFTGLGLYDGYRGDAWLRRRIAIFKRFTLAALLNQTKKEFIVWLAFRPQEEANPLVKDLKRSLDGIRGLTTVFSFRGCCLYDDKHEESIARKRLLRSLQMTLPTLAGFVSDAKWVYLTCQPSDDCYASDVVRTIQNQLPKKGKALGFTDGYVMNYATKEVADYNPDTLPPFSTVIFPRETFLDAEKHLKYIGPYQSHEYVKDHLKLSILKGRGFLVGTHGENISTTWNIPFKGREHLSEEREKILLDFGLWDADPFVVHKSFRLWGRAGYNYLPGALQRVIRVFYHKARSYVRLFKS